MFGASWGQVGGAVGVHGWWVVDGGEAVFDMPVLAILPGAEIRPFA